MITVRYPTSHKPRTRARLLETASRLFKSGGYHGIGVDRIMQAEGLTAGAFYSHFQSKETLLGETFDLAFRQATARILSGLNDREGLEWFREAVRRYLGRPHRDHVAEGCPLPALGADVARSHDRVRARYQAYLEQLAAEFERHLAPSEPAPTDRALAAIALCVGGILLARAVKDRALSDRILQACRRHVLAESVDGGGCSDP